MFKNGARHKQVSAHLESQLLGRLKCVWGGDRMENGEMRKGNHMSFKGNGVLNGEIWKLKAKHGSKSRTPKSLYLLGFTLTSQQGTADSLLISSAWLFPGLAWSPWMHTFRHDHFWEGAQPLTWPMPPCLQHSSPKNTPYLRPRSAKGQATKARLAQKGKCPRLSFYIHFKPLQCQKPAETASGTLAAGPARKVGTCAHAVAGSWLHIDWCAHSHEGTGLWQWQWGDLSLLQLIRKVLLCFQYETFHSKIQSQDFLDSVFTHF